MGETIDRVAIRHKGDVYDVPRPGRHHNVIAEMNKLGFGASDMNDQGFVTSHYRFVDRREAMKIAEAAGQIREKTGPADMLFSEDMW